MLDFVKERIVLDVHFLILGVCSSNLIDAHFSDCSIGAHIITFSLHSAQAAAERVHALEWVLRSRWVRHSKRAINTTTVANLGIVWRSVTSITKVRRAKTVMQGHRAAKVAFPGYVFNAMLLTSLLSCADSFQFALLTY